MGMSIKDLVAQLTPEEREAWVAGLTPQLLKEAARDDWWYTGRPEQMLNEDNWFVALYLAGRGAGKAIDVRQWIPTPDGFVRMGDLNIGDQVFDEHGQPCQVLATFDFTPEKAYRLHFSDGTYIDACSDHQWVTWTHWPEEGFPYDWAACMPVRTTQDIVSTFSQGHLIPKVSASTTKEAHVITGWEVIAPIPMRCITVSSPNSMYLVGKAMIPTHNSRSGSEWLTDRVLKYPLDRAGVPTEHMVIAETLSDARLVNIEGPSGLLNVLNRREVTYRYYKAPKPMIVFGNEAKIHTSGADNPDTARGMNLASALMDEIIKWKSPRQTWYEGIMPALRADLPGDHPRAFITTTPKPIDLLFELVKRTDGSVHVIRGSTFDNAANLSSQVLAEMKLRYAGTTLGLQELYGQLIDAASGNIFNRADLDKYRIADAPDNIVSTVVGVDPGATGENDETGVIVVARDKDNHLYILADATIQAAGRPAALHVWRTLAAWGADTVVVEDNMGKRWLSTVLEDAFIELRDKQGLFDPHTRPPMAHVDSRIGKSLRAQPVGMRLQQGRLHVVGGHEVLENQMVAFDPDAQKKHSVDDRVDALVHAARHLMKSEKRKTHFADPSQYALDRGNNFGVDGFYGITYGGARS